MNETKENVYRRSLGGFVIGYALPLEDGDLRGLKILEIEAIKGDNINKVANKFIESFDDIPERLLLHRTRQLSGLISYQVESGRDLVVVINSAHKLSPMTISNLRRMQDMQFALKLRSRPGFVLLGHPERLEKSVSRYPSIAMRTTPLLKPQLAVVK